MTQVMEPGGAEVMFPPPQGSLRVALLCIAFRAGAEACSYPLTAIGVVYTRRRDVLK